MLTILHCWCAAVALVWLGVIYTFSISADAVLRYTLAVVLAAGVWPVLMLARVASRQRGACRGWGGVGLWICVAVIGGEVLLRQREECLWPEFMRDERLGWSMRPNRRGAEFETQVGTFRVDSDELGYRNRQAPKPGSLIKVLFQGDSNLFGWGHAQQETIASQLDARLGGGAVYNVGVPGYDPHQYYFQFQALAERNAIGTRIILLNTANDFTMAALRTPLLYPRPYLAPQPDGRLRPAGVAGRFQQQVYGNHFIDPFSEFDALIADPLFRDWGDRYPGWITRWSLGRFWVDKYYRYSRRLMHARSATPNEYLELNCADWMLMRRESWPQPFRAYQSSFQLLLRELLGQHKDTVLVLLPMKRQIVSGFREDALQRLREQGVSSDEIDVSAFRRLVEEVVMSAGVRYVDLSDALMALGDDAFYFFDYHITPAASAACAEKIAAVLSDTRG